MGKSKILKSPTIRRLPTYLHKLLEMKKSGDTIVATPVLARYMNIGEIVVRKDLAITGITGQPGVGYRIEELIDAIKTFLNWNIESEAVLVGAGSLGSAILGYEGFEENGLKIIAAFDADEKKFGKKIHNCEIFPVANLTEMTKKLEVKIGVICVPAAYAQEVADNLIAAGVIAIWNFANVALQVPDGVIVQREVIAGGLALLSVKLNSQYYDIN